MRNIQTKDGIKLRNIPEETPEEDIKARVNAIREERKLSNPAGIQINQKSADKAIASAQRTANPSDPWADERALKYNSSTSMMDFLRNKLASGVSMGTGGLVGLGLDAVQAPGKFLARQDVPGFSSGKDQGYFDSTQEYTGYTDSMFGVDQRMKPADKDMEILGHMAEYAGASILPSGRVVSQAKNKIGAAGTEISSVASGGLGSKVIGDMSEDADEGRLSGELLGGILGSKSGGFVPSIVNKFAPKLRPKSVMDKFGKQVSEGSKKELKGIVEAEELAKKVEDSVKVSDAVESVTGKSFKPTLGGRTNSQYIGNLEREVLGRNTESAEKATSAHRANAETLEIFTDSVLPESRKMFQRSADEAVRKANANIKTAINKTRKSLNEAAEELAQERGILAAGIVRTAPQETGKSMQDEIQVKMKAAKKTSDNEIEEIYKRAAKHGVGASMDDITSEVRKLMNKDENLFQKMPPVFSDILGQYAKVTKTHSPKIIGIDGKPLTKTVSPKASFKEIHSLYKETNRLLRSADKEGFATTHAHFLGKLKESLDKKMKKFSTVEEGKVGQGITIWNERYAEFVDTFRKGAAGAAIKDKKGGRMLPSKVVESFFNPEGIDQYIKINGKSPAAMAYLEDGVLDLFSSVAIKKTGKIDAEIASTWLYKKKRVLDKLPKLQKMLEEASKKADDLSVDSPLMDTLNKRMARLEEAKKSVSNGILAKIAGVDDIAPIIEKALTEKTRKTFRVLSITGTEGRKAILHSIASAIPVVAAKQGMTGGQFLEKNIKNIKPILDRYGKGYTDKATGKYVRGHYENIKIAIESLDMLKGGKPPTHPNLTKYNSDRILSLTGTSLPSLQSQLRASAMYGFVSPVHVGASLGTNLWRKMKGDKAAKMQEYLLTNPEAARDFAKAVSSKDIKANEFGNLIRPHMYAAGIRSVLAASDELGKDNKDKK
tara:strand:- start:1162 stop:3996 length:2835 start_codon:yes stop_codon:yes gene_type:complete